MIQRSSSKDSPLIVSHQSHKCVPSSLKKELLQQEKTRLHELVPTMERGLMSIDFSTECLHHKARVIHVYELSQWAGSTKDASRPTVPPRCRTAFKLPFPEQPNYQISFRLIYTICQCHHSSPPPSVLIHINMRTSRTLKWAINLTWLDTPSRATKCLVFPRLPGFSRRT